MVEKPDIKELAVAAWRLEKWLDNLNSDRKMAGKSALRSIKKFISASKVEVKDPVGSKFDPGLAVEVVNNEAECADEEDLIIIETLTPYVYQGKKLIQNARVIIGTDAKTAKTNNEKTQDISDSKTSPTKKVLTTNVCPIDTDKTNSDEAMKMQPVSDEEETDEITIGEKEIERIMKYAKIL